MKLDQLKKGLFGYKKSSVYECVAAMEEEFFEKLSAKDAASRSSEEQYQKRIADLEEALRQVREELERRKNEQMEIAATLMEATRYAEALRQKAEEQTRREREAWEQSLAASQKELDQYQAQVANIREVFCSLLRAVEEQSQAFELQVEAVKAACPEHNMTLFERKEA